MGKNQVIKYALEKGVRPAARKFKIARSTVNDWVRKHKEANKALEEKKKESYKETETSASLTIDSKSFSIRTLDDLIEYSEIDQDVWEAVKVTTNKWEVFSNDHGAQMLYQIKADFRKRKAVEDAKDILDKVVGSACERSLYVPATKYSAETDLMLDISIADHHFGKLSWGKQTEEPYNIEIAKEVYLKASENLLGRAPQVDNVLMVVGNDALHCDNSLNRTRSGNPLDCDTRWEKIFLTAFDAIRDSILMASELAPVHVSIVPGNHDMEKTFCLGHSLQCYFHNNNNVIIDNAPSPRKYYRWGNNLIGMTHGCDETASTLPLIMAQECKEEWAKTEYRQWKIGHFHKKKATNYTAGDTFTGVEVVVSPSLCSADAWHHAKGYVKNVKSAIANIWDYNEGLVGNLQYNHLQQKSIEV